MTDDDLTELSTAAEGLGEYRYWHPAWRRLASTVALQEIDQRWQSWLCYSTVIR